ncbi:DUF4127 family protein, partial [bacterium]|nr:DUF4127 family protein [bacterium]
FIEPQGTNLISKYEDISIKDCILSQISLAGLEVSKKCDLEMIVNNFQSEQGDLVLGDRINSVQKNIYFPKTPYFIADVNNANGADCNLIEQLLKQKTNNFFGYSGYNTSANTIGSAILSAVVKYIAIKNNSYNDNNFK